MSEQERQKSERIREEHEAERMRREDLRRIGEGGPEQHVLGNIKPGRVEAEIGRQKAETTRSRNRGITLAFIMLLPALVGLYLVDRESEIRATENRELIIQLEIQAKQLVEQRDETRRLFRRADLQLCRQSEKLKTQNRIDAQRSFNNLDQTLAVLQLERTPEIERLAKENLERDLRRNMPREGGCQSLPSINGG